MKRLLGVLVLVAALAASHFAAFFWGGTLGYFTGLAASSRTSASLGANFTQASLSRLQRGDRDGAVFVLELALDSYITAWSVAKDPVFPLFERFHARPDSSTWLRVADYRANNPSPSSNAQQRELIERTLKPYAQSEAR